VLTKELSHIPEASPDKLLPDYPMTFALQGLTGLNVVQTAEPRLTIRSNVKVWLNRANPQYFTPEYQKAEYFFNLRVRYRKNC
jgi:hypothetical protein